MNTKQFEKAMKAAASNVSKPLDVLQDIGLLVEGEAKRNAPVRTGTLRRSITNRVEGNAAYVGSAVEYARYVHEGTKYMAAQPFIQDAIDNSRSQIVRLVEEWGGKVLDKVGRG